MCVSKARRRDKKIYVVRIFIPQIKDLQAFTLLVPSALSLACLSSCNLENKADSGNHAVLLLGAFDTRGVILSLEDVSF